MGPCFGVVVSRSRGVFGNGTDDGKDGAEKSDADEFLIRVNRGSVARSM